MKNKITKVKWGAKLTLSDWGQLRKEIEGIGTEDIVRIGASDTSVITGTNSYKCKQKLFYHLVGLKSFFFINPRTVAGHMNEPTIVKHFEAYQTEDEQQYLIDALDGVRHRKLTKANYFLLNNSYPNSFVSLDYTIEGKQYSPLTGELYPKGTPVEMKTADKWYYMEWVDGITPAYYDQVQYQMLLTNKPMCVFLVLVDKEHLKVKEIYADRDRQAFIIEEVNKFAEKVRVGKMALAGMKEAEIDGDTETYNGFKAIFDSVTPEPVGTDDNVATQKEMNDSIDKDADLLQGDVEDYNYISRYLKLLSLEAKIKEQKNLIISKMLQKLNNMWRGIKVGDLKFTYNKGRVSFKREKEK